MNSDDQPRITSKNSIELQAAVLEARANGLDLTLKDEIYFLKDVAGNVFKDKVSSFRHHATPLIEVEEFVSKAFRHYAFQILSNQTFVADGDIDDATWEIDGYSILGNGRYNLSSDRRAVLHLEFTRDSLTVQDYFLDVGFPPAATLMDWQSQLMKDHELLTHFLVYVREKGIRHRIFANTVHLEPCDISVSRGSLTIGMRWRTPIEDLTKVLDVIKAYQTCRHHSDLYAIPERGLETQLEVDLI